MVNEEMNMFKLLELLRKLKVSISIIIGNDKEKLDKIEKLYIECSTIFTCNKA